MKIRLVIETDVEDQEQSFQRAQVGRMAYAAGNIAGTMLPGTVRIWTEELAGPVIDGNKWTKGQEFPVA